MHNVHPTKGRFLLLRAAFRFLSPAKPFTSALPPLAVASEAVLPLTSPLAGHHAALPPLVCRNGTE